MRKFLFLVVFLAFGVSAFATCTLPCVQITNGNTTTTIPSNVGNNRLLAVWVFWCANAGCSGTATSGETVTLTHDLAGTVNLIRRNDTTPYGLATYWIHITTGGAEVLHLTVTGPETPSYMTTVVTEFDTTDVSPLDEDGINNGNSTSPTISTDAATNFASEIVWAVQVGFNAATTPAAGYTQSGNNDEYKVVAATGVQTATWTVSESATPWVTNIATFTYTPTPVSGTCKGNMLRGLAGC